MAGEDPGMKIANLSRDKLPFRFGHENSLTSPAGQLKNDYSPLENTEVHWRPCE